METTKLFVHMCLMSGRTGKRAYLYDGEITEKGMETEKQYNFDFSDLIVCLNLGHNKSINLHKLLKLFFFSFLFLMQYEK